MSKSNYLCGIDLGGTKIEGAVIERNDRSNIIFRERIDTEGDKGYEHVVSQISKMVSMMETAVDIPCTTIGIGTPGTIDPHTGLLKNSNSTHLNDKPFHKDLAAAIGKELIMANDADCFALAEARMGVVQDIMPDAEVVFGVIMGTGVGGGIVVDGKVINGHQGIAGEWGHNFLDESGGRCYCGKIGCVETVISGPALEKYYETISGKRKRLKEITKCREDDPYAIKTIERLHHFFGIGLSVVINILDPQVIVIGGGVGNIESLYTEGVKNVEKNIFNSRLDTKIVAPKLGDSAGVFGAALLTL